MEELKIERKWAMPNKNTFDIKPIKELILQEKTEGLWIDPFANKNKIADITNDLNEKFDTTYHLDALEFLKQFDDCSVDGVLFDPPYSPYQIKTVYESVGLKCPKESASFWSKIKKEIIRILKPNGKCISFCWNSGGVGSDCMKKTHILLVAHGGWHNDTIVTVEKKDNVLF